MAVKATWSNIMLGVLLAIQMVALPSSADDTAKGWDQTINALGDGINWMAEKVANVKGSDVLNMLREGKKLLLDESMNAERSARHLRAEEDLDQAEGEDSDAEGRLFFGTGNNGTNVTLNLQAIQSAIGAAIVIGFAILIILIIISLVTGRDLYSLSKGFTNRFNYPYDDSWYAPNNYNYYKDESSYTAYRALEDADKKYGEAEEQH